MNEQQYYVEVVRYSDDTVTKRLGPMTGRKAERVEDALNINLNHAEYFTRVVTEGEASDAK